MCARRRKDLVLTGKIPAIHRRSREHLWLAEIHAELADDHGIRVGRKRVARLMRSAGPARRYAAQVRGDHQSDPARQSPWIWSSGSSLPTGPDQLWVADITYIPTWVGLAVSGDGAGCVRRARSSAGRWTRTCAPSWSWRRCEMALTQRRPSGVIHHSDQGCQYTSYAFGKRCREEGVMPSMGSVGDAYDNAMAESFFATLEREVLESAALQDARPRPAWRSSNGSRAGMRIPRESAADSSACRAGVPRHAGPRVTGRCYSRSVVDVRQRALAVLAAKAVFCLRIDSPLSVSR